MAAKHFKLQVKSIAHVEGFVVVTQYYIDLFVAIWNSILLVVCFLYLTLILESSAIGHFF